MWNSVSAVENMEETEQTVVNLGYSKTQHKPKHVI